MAEPASKLPEEDHADIRSDLGRREALNTSSSTSQSSQSTSTGTRARSGGSSSNTGSSDGGAASQTGDTKGFLRQGEEAGDQADDGGYYKDDSSSSTGKRRIKITRRRAAAAGAGGGLIALIIGFSSIGTGPLEFIHIAQLLDKFHFSALQDAQNGRLMKIVRYIKTPDKPQNTRLGYVGNKVADKLETSMKDSTGLEPKYNSASGRFEGYTIDRQHDSFKGKSEAEIKNQLASQYNVSEGAISGSGDHMTFNPDTAGLRNPIRGYISQTKTARVMLSEAGYSKLSSYVGSRILGTRAGWTFHPIKAFDSAYQAKLIEGGKAALDKAKEQFNNEEKTAINSDTTTPTISENPNEQDAHGNPQSDPARTSAADGGQNIENNPSESNIKAKITGGGAALIGVACVMKGINDQVPQLREAKVMLPMMKLAGQIMSLGSQIQSGQDLTATQVGFFKQFLDGTDAQGKTTVWSQSKSFQAELGQPQTGPDIPKSAQVFNGGVPFEFLSQGAVGSVIGTTCDVLGSPFGIIASAIIAPFSTAFQQFAVGPALNALVSDAAGWLSGAPIDIFKGAGAIDGGFMNYGARLSANQQAASASGVQMDSTSEQQLAMAENSLDQTEFNSKSIAYRLFNTHDYQSLASRLMDRYDTNSGVQNVASMTQNFGSIFGAVARIPATLFSGITHAADPPYDWHGLQKVGIRADQLADPRFDNPFANACWVVGGNCQVTTGPNQKQTITDAMSVLGGPNGADYIDRAQKCFGAKITNDPTNGWTIDTSQSVDIENPDTYPSSACQDGNLAWLRLRFWLLDTPTIEGYDCFRGGSSTSDQSCQDVGFNSAGSSASTTTTTSTNTGTLPSGSSKDLAKQLLPYLGKQIKCNGGEGTNCSDISNTANGTSIKGGSCQVDALQPGLLGLMLGLVQAGHTFVLSAICSDHSTVDGLTEHNGGRAADFNTIDGVFMGPNATEPWSSDKIAAAKKLDQDAANLITDKSKLEFGQVGAGKGYPQCHPTFDFQNGYHNYPDACHHQHIAVET